MRLAELVELAVRFEASDVHFTAGKPPVFRINGVLYPLDDPCLREGLGVKEEFTRPLTPEDTLRLAQEVMTPQQFARFEQEGEIDFSFGFPGVARVRANIFKQRGSVALALRILSSRIPTFQELGLPEVVAYLARRPAGLVLVTGPTGSGKSTTLAAMINLINREKRLHIITLEDPIEYLHRHEKSIVNQREVGQDTKSFARALRAALREDPDVIMVGEMRDLETIATAITAAETGHLVLATLHTVSAAETVDRIVDVFPPGQQQQIRVQLANVIEGVISQLLLPRADGKGRVLALEIMVATPAIRNLIREGKTYQITSHLQTGGRWGMQTMDAALASLYRQGLISREELLNRARDPELLQRLVGV
ncbi:type IV pilus twitching motility protein PilT [Ammonifex thiophilus]|uniref:Type IV pilus twitching motility protein PilT n=1 Tax=Ammonifex thiophilus TaxID=444093 RepID=A0A3D8P3A9_9THEO|nr:type IV pilus twitching motility protein PilT [Ammonifex thiophilus]RDV83225.1 type IV pilus twitching motility protein PilT [Ammonifex thiophilus]